MVIKKALDRAVKYANKIKKEHKVAYWAIMISLWVVFPEEMGIFHGVKLLLRFFQ